MKDILISMIICTYNREDLLEGAILSLVNQSLPSDQYEILIVDNNSTDSTKEITDSFIDHHPNHSIRYILEKTSGVGYARKTGALEASGKYVGFLDDDGKADAYYLENADKAIRSFTDGLLSFGGPIYPFYLASKPDWFKDEYEIRTWGNELKWLEMGAYLAGSNMFFLKEVFLKVSKNSETLGPRAEQMAFGEDTILFENFKTGYPENQVLYIPDLIVYHAVPEIKMTLNYILKRRYSIGCSAFERIILTEKKNIYLQLFLHGAYLLWQVLIFVFSIFQYRHWQQWVVEKFGPVAKSIGFLMTLFKVPLKFTNR